MTMNTKNRIVLALITGLIIISSFELMTAQETDLYPKKGRASVTKTFRPKSTTDADVYTIYIRKKQEVSIKVTSNSVYLFKGNKCGMYFRLFDDKGEEFKIGDSPAGIDQWSGYVDRAGTYQLKIRMGCLESFPRQLIARKPKFTYTLSFFQPPAPSR